MLFWFICVTIFSDQPYKLVLGVTLRTIFMFISCHIQETIFCYLNIYLFVGDLLVLLLVTSCGIFSVFTKSNKIILIMLGSLFYLSIVLYFKNFKRLFLPFGRNLLFLLDIALLAWLLIFIASIIRENIGKNLLRKIRPWKPFYLLGFS